MPRPNPPRKRPRRRPDSVERNTRAEVALTKQTAQVKEKNGSDAKPQSSAKAAAASKPRPALKGAAARAQRLNEPYVPWAKRSYAILIALMAAGELIIGSLAYFTLSGTKPSFGIFLLGINADSLGPLIAVAAALVAAQVTKYITKESRSLRFMETAMAGVTQYFIWFALFVGLLYLFGLGSASSSSKSLTVFEPLEIAGLAFIDVVSFVGAYFIYPPLYRRMRIKPPPPRVPRQPKPEKPQPAPKTPKSMVDKMDDASARNQEAQDTTA
jgi:hypothetical protein